MIMDINKENYTKALEKIKASEKFLSETKQLMLEEAEKSHKPNRKPVIMKITPYAAAAACIALIAAVSVNLLNDKGIDSAATADNSVYTEPYTDSDEVDIDESVPETFIADEIADEETDTTAAVTENPNTNSSADEAEQPEPVKASASLAVEDNANDNAADDTADMDNANKNAAEDCIIEECVEDTNADEDNGNYQNSFDVPTEEENSDFDGGTNDTGDEDDVDADVEDDDDIDVPEDDSPVEPRFSKLSGGRAAAYIDFSPTDAAALQEFLTLVSQDDINAEVTQADQNCTDIFGEKALALNAAFANAVKELEQCPAESFEPTFSFSVFDNVSGDILYTVRTNGSIISVRIRNGETAYFKADNTTIDAIFSAAE